MTLNERFVGGNPRVLLLLFSLFCKGINSIEGNYYLELDTLTTMSFIKTHVPSHNFQNEWRVNRDNCLIILPNPDITNPEVVENLLYVGTNPQVHNDGDDGCDDGYNLFDRFRVFAL